MSAQLSAFPTAVQAQMEFSLDEVDEEESEPAKQSEGEGDLIEELSGRSRASARRNR
jgi:hypothetical protein